MFMHYFIAVIISCLTPIFHDYRNCLRVKDYLPNFWIQTMKVTKEQVESQASRILDWSTIQRFQDRGGRRIHFYWYPG